MQTKPDQTWVGKCIQFVTQCLFHSPHRQHGNGAQDEPSDGWLHVDNWASCWESWSPGNWTSPGIHWIIASNDCGFGPDGCESCVKRVSNSHMWLERKANVDVVRAKLSWSRDAALCRWGFMDFADELFVEDMAGRGLISWSNISHAGSVQLS